MKQWLTLSILKNKCTQYSSCDSKRSSKKINLKLTGEQRSFRGKNKNKLGFTKLNFKEKKVSLKLELAIIFIKIMVWGYKAFCFGNLVKGIGLEIIYLLYVTIVLYKYLNELNELWGMASFKQGTDFPLF